MHTGHTAFKPMVDDPQVSRPQPGHPSSRPSAADSLAARADAASLDELRRSHRLVIGSEGAYWDRQLSTGAIWFSDNFFVALGLDHSSDPDAITGLIHPDDQAAFSEVHEAAVRRIGAFEAELRYRHRSGAFRWARVQGRVWPDAEGRADRVVGMVTDVHEHRLARDELMQHRERLQQMVEQRTASLEAALADAQRQHEDAERANQTKSTFLAHMSHEIRTPLNGVLGLNEMALREARNDQQRRYLKLALQSGRGLLDMLNGVLDFSQLSAGGPPPKLEAFDLAETLASSMRQVMPMVRVKNLDMMFDYAGPVSQVVGDAQRIQQIVANLLTNATKFTESGHVALTATVQLEGVDRCQALIEVRDTGTGLPTEMAERVFEPFVQGDASLARRHGGTGLGLPIARGLAESMGGSLSLRDTLGDGACFRLVLSLQVQPGEQPIVQRPSPGTAWLVHSRAVPAEWLATRVTRLGWRGEVVAGLVGVMARAEAVAAAGTGSPDLVVLVEGALEAATPLGDLRRLLPHTAIVLVVRPDWNQPQVEAAARANDMPLAFMPLTPASLLELLSLHGPSPVPPDSFLGELSAGAGSGADVLIAEDNPVNQLIITEMVASLGLRPRLVENGAQAVSACRARAPNLVLMDLQMPEVDGLEATRQLCELQRQGQVQPFPIVALTAHATPQDRELCLAAGMQGFLTKPISLGLLRTELQRWVSV